MLQEAFELPTTQILSLFAQSKYLASKPELSVCISTVAHTMRCEDSYLLSFLFFFLFLSKRGTLFLLIGSI